MRPRASDVFADALNDLASRAGQDRPAADFAAYAFLCEGAAGFPHVVMFEEAIKDAAKEWSDIATPPELEAYFMAAGARLAASAHMMHGRFIKRIIAALWAGMSPGEQAAFLKWAEGKRNA